MSEVKPKWVKNLQSDFKGVKTEVKELRNQVKINCSKLDKTHKKISVVNAKLDGIGGRLFGMEASQKKTEKQLGGHSLKQIFEICTANGKAIGMLDK